MPVKADVAPLRLPAFRRLLAAYTVNELGDSVALVALALLVYGKTDSALSTTALFVATRFLPALLSPLIVARVDQLPVRAVLPAIYLAEAAVFAALAALSGSFALPPILLLGLLDGTLAITGRGLVRSAVAGVLEPAGLLREGNAIMNVGFAVAAVGGAALGGVLVAGLGFAEALLADAASFLLIAVLLVTARTMPVTRAPRETFGSRLRGGLGFVRREPAIRLLIAGQTAALVLFTLIVPIEVVYAREVLGTDGTGFGLLLSAWGAGIVLGSLIFLGAKRMAPIALVAVSTAAVGIAYVGMSLVTTLPAACAFSVLGGTGNGVQWVAVMTALQMATPPALQARVVGLLESLAAAVPGVGFVVGGVLTSATSASTAYAVAGWGLLALLAVGALKRPRLPESEGPRPPAQPLPIGREAPAEQLADLGGRRDG